MKQSPVRKLMILTFISALAFAYYYFNLGQYLSFQTLKTNQENISQFYTANPLLSIIFYFAIYIIATALSLPGATILTLGGGAIFGFSLGLILVSFASSIGATLAFLTARYLLRETIQTKFSERIKIFDQGIEKEGELYLFTIRLIPIFPFFLINLAMGITKIKTFKFYIISQLGMLAGTAVYVNAGTQLAQLDSIKGILSPNIIISFVLIGIFPLISKKLINFFKSNKNLRKFKKPRNFEYNLVVIGGGSAGLVSSYIASAVKAKVAIIEKHKMGGDCLNTGCVPSKALIKSAKVLNYSKRASEFGIESSGFKVDFQKVMSRVQNVIKKIEPHDSIERYTELGVECHKGNANIKSPYEVEVNGKILTTKNIVVATGASPLVPNIPGLNLVPYLTSDNVWSLKELPKKLVVLGGGPIGCELAQSFSTFGSDVTIIEMSPRIMSREDKDVSQHITEKFIASGIKVLTFHKALRIEINNSSPILICEINNQEVQIPFDHVLLAIGRRPNINGFGLENLNIEISKSGTIVADEYLRTTSYPNIYVCGDVTGPYQFTHTASHQAWYVAVNALFSPLKKFKVDYRVIPWCTFTDPEVARVGLSEQDATEKNIIYEVTKYELNDLDRAIAENEDHGFVKVLTAPGSDKILGATIVGEHAGELITEYVTAMKQNLGLNQILSTIHIYPTFSEANKYAAGIWKKKNAPQKILTLLKSFHNWRRS